MSFVYKNYLIYGVLIFFLFSFFYWRKDKLFFKWVEDHWFYKRTPFARFSLILYLLGFFLLTLSLFDLRGPEKKLDSQVPKQKTLILIDTSSSMLVEDVRPNRFEKSLMMARHFVKKAAGHQIGVIIFSDLTKKLIPFTGDTDLIDARISSLSSMKLRRGGSKISLALQEALTYFAPADKEKDKKVSGNILVFSDSEETVDAYNLSIPDGVSVAFVGVGTSKGGKIPVRNNKGGFLGYKRFNGKDINSKLDEGFLKRLGSKIKRYKYWVALSYSIPTEEILRFFSKIHRQKFEKGQISIRPVLLEYLLIPALLLISLASLFRLFPSFIAPMLVLFSFSANSQLPPVMSEKDFQKISENADLQSKLLKDIQDGNASGESKLKLAETFLKGQQPEKALKVYEENKKSIDSSADSLFNYGTSQLQNGHFLKAKDAYDKALEKVKGTSDYSKYKEMARKNTLATIQNLENIEKRKKEQKKKGEGGEGDSQKQEAKDKNKENKDGEESKEEQTKKESENDQEGEKGNKEGKKEGQAQNKKTKEDSKPLDLEKKKKGDPQSISEKKIAKEQNKNKSKGKSGKKQARGILKQLLDEDRKLNERLLDTKTYKRGQRGKTKDW